MLVCRKLETQTSRGASNFTEQDFLLSHITFTLLQLTLRSCSDFHNARCILIQRRRDSTIYVNTDYQKIKFRNIGWWLRENGNGWMVLCEVQVDNWLLLTFWSLSNSMSWHDQSEGSSFLRKLRTGQIARSQRHVSCFSAQGEGRKPWDKNVPPYILSSSLSDVTG